MKNFIYLVLIAFFIGFCLTCIAQEAISPQDTWQPEARIWVDASGSMKTRLESVKSDIEEMINYGQIEVKSINGFYNRYTNKEIQKPKCNNIQELRLAQNSRDTLSPVIECLEEATTELSDYQILFFATDEVYEPEKAENLDTKKCIEAFRTFVKNDSSCPWVFFMKDKYSRGSEKSNYRIYVMLKYNPEEIDALQQDKIALQFLRFLDDVCGKMGRKVELFDFQPPENFVVLDVSPRNKWETWPSGAMIDSTYDYRIKYVPKAYLLLKGRFEISMDDPLSIKDFYGKNRATEYDVRMWRADTKKSQENPDPTYHSVSLGNLSRAEPLDIKVNPILRAPKHSWRDFFSARNKGFVDGNLSAIASEIVFSPPQDEYPNLIIDDARERIEIAPSSKANMQFRYIIKYPKSWMFWRVFLVILFFALFILLVFVIFRPRSRGKVEILANGVPLTIMDLDRESSGSLESKFGDDIVYLGRVMRDKNSKILKFAPSDRISKVDGKEIEPNGKSINMHIDKPLALELLRDNEAQDESFNPLGILDLVFRRPLIQIDSDHVEKPFYP